MLPTEATEAIDAVENIDDIESDDVRVVNADGRMLLPNRVTITVEAARR
jgi:hypothetical protein